MTQYRSVDIFPLEPEWSTPLERSSLMDRYLFQHIGVGFRESIWTEAEYRFKLGMLLLSKADIWSLISFFDLQLGMASGFWIPTFRRDIFLTAGFGSGDLNLTIQDVGYPTTWLLNSITGRHLRIKRADGSSIYRAVQDAPDGTTLTLETAPGFACTTGEARALLVSFLLYVRFDVDELEMEHIANSKARAKLSFATDSAGSFTVGGS